MTLPAQAEIDYFAPQRRDVPADVMAEQVMREQKVAGPARHLTWFGKIHQRVPGRRDERVRLHYQ